MFGDVRYQTILVNILVKCQVSDHTCKQVSDHTCKQLVVAWIMNNLFAFESVYKPKQVMLNKFLPWFFINATRDTETVQKIRIKGQIKKKNNPVLILLIVKYSLWANLTVKTCGKALGIKHICSLYKKEWHKLE